MRKEREWPVIPAPDPHNSEVLAERTEDAVIEEGQTDGIEVDEQSTKVFRMAHKTDKVICIYKYIMT